jgi:hypothetical protein
VFLLFGESLHFYILSESWRLIACLSFLEKWRGLFLGFGCSVGKAISLGQPRWLSWARQWANCPLIGQKLCFLHQ